MVRIWWILVVISFSRLAYTQQGPPPEIDEVVRATVRLLMESEVVKLSDFINQYYSLKWRNTGNPEILESELRELRQNTLGAGAVDVAIEDGQFQIRFSEGRDAIVLLEFDPQEKAKISALHLLEKKDPALMSGEEKYNAALETMVHHIESLARYRSDDEFSQFINDHFSKDLRSRQNPDTLLRTLRKTGLIVASAMTIQALPLEEQGRGVLLQFRGPKSADVRMELEEQEPFLIKSFTLDPVNFAMDTEPLIPMSLENCRERLLEEEQKGFSGVVLMVKNGQVQVEQGYGYADREKALVNTPGTVFDIGSVPIDFTRAAILKLIDLGKLRYEDALSVFFGQIPEDKQEITIEQLMTDQSGLANFHHDESRDQDYDLDWIDREEALQRIFARPLVAKPGTEILPSHSAYTLLAAIVEIVGGKTYEEFLSEHFFRPMGMSKTGPYGRFPGSYAEHQAVGYGHQATQPNVPAEWGKTSWLVKGSGGMVSNPADLYLWYKNLQTGDYLSTGSRDKYGFGKLALGGSERGFFTCVLKDAADTVMICSNSDPGKYEDTFLLFRSLLALVEK